LHYNIRTKYLALKFDSTTLEDQVFLIYSNIAFADNKSTKYSSNRYAIKLFGKMLHFKAIKQKIIITTSIKVKLLAFTLITKEYI
jgi:hypothetical protein